MPGSYSLCQQQSKPLKAETDTRCAPSDSINLNSRAPSAEEEDADDDVGEGGGCR